LQDGWAWDRWRDRVNEALGIRSHLLNLLYYSAF